MWLLRFQSFCCSLQGFALCSCSSSDSAQPFSPDHPAIDPHRVLFEWSPPLIAQTMRKWLSKVAHWLSVCGGVSRCSPAAPLFVRLIWAKCQRTQTYSMSWFLSSRSISFEDSLFFRFAKENKKLDFPSSQSLHFILCNLQPNCAHQSP